MRLFLFSVHFVVIIFISVFLLSVVGLIVFAMKGAGDIADLYIVSRNQISGCQNEDSRYRDPALPLESRVGDLLGRMTLEEKVGQMTLIEKNSLKDTSDIQKYGIGGLLSGGGGYPSPNTPEAWWKMIDDFDSYSKKDCSGIPLLYGVDAVHGDGILPTATIFPHSIALGAANDSDLVKRVAAATAEEMAATGVYWDFFPSLDVAKDVRWGRVYETFGSDTKRVTALGDAYVEGFQSVSFSGIRPMATAKHYIGSGAMEWGSSDNPSYKMDQGDAKIDEAALRAEALPPFRSAIRKGVGSVMVGLNKWNGTKMNSNKYLISDVLKGELDFQGLVVSDWHGASGLAFDECESWSVAINAGVDMIMVPSDYERFTTCIKNAVQEGKISSSRIDDAVSRILRAKFAMGLFDRTIISFDASVIGCAAHREIAREAVRKSLVLLKNNDVLPLAKDAERILVAGPAADSLGRQAGGWTVEWQGTEGNSISGTTILSGIKSAVPDESKVWFNEKGEFSIYDTKADVGIVIVGEKPYAEGWGDSENPTLTEEDLALISRMRNTSSRLVVVIISGRPLDIKKYAKDWDAVVAA